MKCPKCHYLGFESGDRCRNCGYDFSFLSEGEGGARPDPDPDPELHEAPEGPALVDLPLNLAPFDGDADTSVDLRLDDREIAFAEERAAPVPIRVDEADPERRPVQPERPTPRKRSTPIDGVPAIRAASASPRRDGALPLFTPTADDEDDTPLVRLPSAPRPPLAVRRTPDLQRPRSVPTPPARTIEVDAEPTLVFAEPAPSDASDLGSGSERRPGGPDWRVADAAALDGGGAVARLSAMAIDYAILLSIDLVVTYFTLRVVALDLQSWAMLPRMPLLLFLVLIKLSYFTAFTAVGGQTIGKMATHIRVVSDECRGVGVSQAVRRTLAGLLSVLTFGLAYLPGLVGEHRALHDRVAHTRVIGAGPA